jgi:hypothetical protein
LKIHSKILVVTLFLLLFTLPSLFSVGLRTTTINEIPVKETLVSQTGHKVLFDEAHTALGSATFTPGNASLFAWMLEEHGYETDMNFDQDLDSGILTGVDILILFFPMVALTGAEVTAVNNFVQAGGGLLLVGTDNNPTWQFSSSNLNAISQTYGVTFSTDTADAWIATTSDFVSHHITQDVSAIHSNIDFKLKGTTLTVESPATSIISEDGNPVVAVAEAGSGKVVCVGALSPFLQYRRNMNWQIENDDLFQFSLNIADWLVGISPRKVAASGRAVITIGSGPSLTPLELDNYNAYTGIIHDHTSHSDGSDSPADILWAGLSRGLDYMAMTDHTYEAANPMGVGGITGALAMKAIADQKSLDIEIFAGAELSRGHHSVAFPINENIYVNTQADMVAGAHAQGAMISLAHPTISAPYMATYELFDSYGYDSIEVTCDGFSHGLWDEGFTRPFYGASDGHTFEDVSHILNIAFVDQPTGPNGRFADVDLKDAIMDRRMVILDKVTNILYGQKVWVDRYIELMELAETEIASAKSIVEPADEAGVTLASQYLQDAEVAFAYGSPKRAINAATNSTTAEALDISIDVVSPDPRFLYPSTTHNLVLNISSTNSDAIQFNMTRYNIRAWDIDPSNELILAPGNGYTNWTTNVTMPLVGYCAVVFSLHDFNTTSTLAPIIYGVGALTNTGGHFEIERDVNGTHVTSILAIARGDVRYISTVLGFYDDGSGWQNGTALVRTATIEGTIGPYLRGTVITYYLVVYDIFGGVFVSPQANYTVTTDPLEPTTSTTTTDSGPPIEINPVLLLGITGGVIAIIVVVVFLNKRKGVT